MPETKPGQTSQETSKENTGLQFERRDIITVSYTHQTLPTICSV